VRGPGELRATLWRPAATSAPNRARAATARRDAATAPSGLATRTAVEVEVGPPKPYEQILDGIMVLEGGSREAFRRSQATLESIASTGAFEELPQDIESPIDAEISDDSPETAVGSTEWRTIRRRST
jgi:hypothetical protein